MLLSIILCYVFFCTLDVSVKVLTAEVAIAGLNHTLECAVSGVESLSSSNSNITYLWGRSDGLLELETDLVYEFIPTAEDNGEIYDCTATIDSPILSSPISASGIAVIYVLGNCLFHKHVWLITL